MRLSGSREEVLKLVEIIRDTFFTMQKYGRSEFGLKQRDGYSFKVDDASYTAHCLSDEETVVISDNCIGVSVKKVTVLVWDDERDMVERAVEMFLKDEEYLNKLKNYRKTPKYGYQRKAFELMLNARSYMNMAERSSV